ncbi:translation initiation factor if-2 [Lichtheimia corymbifera JMRC:FSU:9682]|uniref:Translation initiation factor IF-2, mitochondrial n=1 Tax=Lichtheimia corymbifera JMRC:FSU:9682 TaxID=1263082 RepID=A0A068RPK8_9FUNG|nr:translation initiation factor if-2 [Lichtheimia corymbifera JMRC:FSU:9682]
MNGQRVFVLGTQQCRRLLSTSTIRYSLGRPNALEGAAGPRKKKIGKTDWSRPQQQQKQGQQQQGSKRNKVPAKRDWSRPSDIESKKPPQQQQQQQQQRDQRRERNKKRDEEVALFMKQQEAEMQKLKAKQKAKAQEEKQVQDVYIPHVINAANLSRLLGVRLEHLIRTMEELEMDNVSHDRMLSADESSLIAMQLDMNPIVDERQALDLYPRPLPTDMSNLPTRPPVVTIMGHVDHGKTTLLDTLRKTSVAAGEAGGITQHIGAFSVTLPSKKSITFLDTPGHAAFSSMRARGAQVTDIVVLVVAADDGVMPQTREAIEHAQSAGVPIVVAINKCDKPGVDSTRVKQDLARYNVHLEEIGGDVPAVEVSGLTGKNLDQLEETIATLSEVLELRAERTNGAEGVVIESQVEKGRGNVATVLVRRGTLKPGSTVVAGQTWCKVRSMTDHQGKTLKEAPPGTPVKVTGWKEVPMAGDEMLQAKDEGMAKTVVDNRKARHQREQQLRDLQVINEKRRQQRELLEQERMVEKEYKKEMYMFQQGLIDSPPESLGKRLSAIQASLQDDQKIEKKDDMLEYRAVVKGDVSGTVEAVVDCLNGLQNKQIRVKVVESGVGNITEGDVQLAAACEGHVIGFNVKADKKIQSEASKRGVGVRSYSVIYKLLEEVKDQLSDMLPPIVSTQVVGEASILQIFDISIKGRETRAVAGCRVTNGAIQRNGRVRVVRDKETVWEGELDALRQVKKDIMEAKKGLECGMSFEGFTGFKVGDVIQSIQTIETKQRL